MVAIVAASLLTAAIVMTAFEVVPEMNGETLRSSLTEIGRSLTTMSLEDCRRMIAPFLAGLTIGAGLALRWARRRLPWRSVLLVDSRVPDMSLDALLARVRSQASHDEQQAARIILAAARARALSTWTRSPSGAVRRAPRRLIRAALTGGGGEPALGVGIANNLLFSRNEVDTLWPEAALMTITVPMVLRQSQTPDCFH